MSAVISESTTVWNKETKQTDVDIVLFNYTTRPRAYTILATWPEKAGAKMENNDTGGRKEALGVWAWKLEALQPGERKNITYSLSGLESGDWTDTEILFRGAQDVIGATKMDEKFLQEIRRQEQLLLEDEGGNAQSEPSTKESSPEPTPKVAPIAEAPPVAAEIVEPAVAPPEGQRTLFGGDV